MTHVDHAKATPLPGETRSGELRRAGVFLVAGAVALGAVMPFGPVAYHWLPFIVGTAMVVGSFLGGRGSRFMGPGLPVLFWGIAIVLTSAYRFTGDYSLSTGMIGLGAIGAWALSSRGWPSNSFAVGGGIVLIGFGQFVHGTYGEWATFYVAMVLGALAALELFSIRTDRRDRGVVGEVKPSQGPARAVAGERGAGVAEHPAQV